MKVSVIGGGPGGLYFSMLLKQALPASEVTVYEQSAPEATFGFGVALHGASWDFVKADSEACFQDIIANAEVFYGQEIVHRGQRIYFSDTQPNAGIARIALLRVLRKHAEQNGVVIRSGQPLTSLAPLTDQDLIVGADGVNSLVRREHAEAFGVSQRVLTSRMAWYGLDRKITQARLVFKKTEYGYFWYVAYPHSASQSTFVAECDAKAYHASGLGEMTEQEQVAFIEAIFADELDGARVLYNKSIWRALPVTRVRNWSVNNCVLLGDALHSPHPSIGSGTRLSMSDASALAACIGRTPDDIGQALGEYRRVREPVKMKLVVPMERSLEWYERIADELDDLDEIQLTFSWLSRTGRMGPTRLKETAPEFYRLYGHLAPDWLLDRLNHPQDA